MLRIQMSNQPTQDLAVWLYVGREDPRVTKNIKIMTENTMPQTQLVHVMGNQK